MLRLIGVVQICMLNVSVKMSITCSVERKIESPTTYLAWLISVKFIETSTQTESGAY